MEVVYMSMAVVYMCVCVRTYCVTRLHGQISFIYCQTNATCLWFAALQHRKPSCPSAQTHIYSLISLAIQPHQGLTAKACTCISKSGVCCGAIIVFQPKSLGASDAIRPLRHHNRKTMKSNTRNHVYRNIAPKTGSFYDPLFALRKFALLQASIDTLGCYHCADGSCPTNTHQSQDAAS